jgi:hypothetical protein
LIRFVKRAQELGFTLSEIATARVVVAEDTVTVTLPHRAHDPILLDAGVIGAPTKIPW